MAPEFFKGSDGQSEYDRTVDWWAVGILMYEMLTGSCPFHADRKTKLIQNIGRGKIEWPHDISASNDFKDLVVKLLKQIPENRIGYNGGAEEVLRHPWFPRSNYI